MRKISILLVSMVLASCSPTTTVTSEKDFNPLQISYFKDSRTNLCFAVVTYERVSSNAVSSQGLSHSNVPCSEEVLKFIRK